MGSYVTLKLKVDEAQGVEAFRKLTAAEQQATLASKKLGLQSEKTSRTSRSGAEESVRAMQGWASGLLSVTAGLAVVKRAFSDIKADAQAAAARIDEATLARSSLTQLAQTPTELRRLHAEAGKSRRKGLPAAEAYNLQFEVESLGMAEHRGLFASLYPIVDAPGQIAGGVSTIRAAMGPAEAGTVRQVTNKLFAASKISRARATEFAPAMAEAAGTAGMLKVSDEELFAAIARVTKPAGGAGQAATQVDAFQRALIRHGMGGMGLVGAAKAIEARGWKPQRLQKFFGRVQGLRGYANILKMAEPIAQTTGEMHAVGAATGTEGDYIGRMTGVQGAVPSNLVADAARTARLQMEQSREGSAGIEEQLRQFARSRVRQGANELGDNDLSLWWRTAKMDVLTSLRADPETLAMQGATGTQRTDILHALHELRDALREQARFSRNGGAE